MIFRKTYGRQLSLKEYYSYQVLVAEKGILLNLQFFSKYFVPYIFHS